ncbi:MAG: hypothetical protein QXI42_11515 [Thermoproteota archaeon]|jgi:hypothetical protein
MERKMPKPQLPSDFTTADKLVESRYQRFVEELRGLLSEKKYSKALSLVKEYLAEAGVYVNRICCIFVESDKVKIFPQGSQHVVVITQDIIYITDVT